MTEEENMGVEEEQLHGQPQDQTEDVSQDDVSTEAEQAEQRKRNDAEYNWAEMRRQRERDREELEALKAELNQLKPKEKPKEEDDFGISDDDLLEGRHLKDLKREIRALKAELQQKEASTMEERIQMKFPDYNDVVSKDNIEYLKKTEPELAQSISSMQDPYKQAVAAYKLLKTINAGKEPTIEQKKAIQNSQKPVSANAVTKNSAIGNAHLFENGLSKDLKKQLWEEMQAAKRAG